MKPQRRGFLKACTAGTATLLTGRLGTDLPTAANSAGAKPNIIFILTDDLGYATGMVGKWHLGTRPQFLPTRQGFDYYYGMPGPNHGVSDLYRGQQRLAVNQDVDLDEWTATCTAEAIQFIRRSKGKPFFLYLAHGAPHIPLHVLDRFRGKWARGLYGDLIEEIDWSVGEILQTLRDENLDPNTLVICTSTSRASVGPAGCRPRHWWTENPSRLRLGSTIWRPTSARRATWLPSTRKSWRACKDS